MIASDSSDNLKERLLLTMFFFQVMKKKSKKGHETFNVAYVSLSSDTDDTFPMHPEAESNQELEENQYVVEDDIPTAASGQLNERSGNLGNFYQTHRGNGAEDKFSDQETLCACTQSTASDVMFMILSLGLKHGLSWDAQVDILKMVASIFGDAKVPLTKYMFLKDVCVPDDSIKRHIVCKDCDTYVGVHNNDEYKNVECTNEKCKSEIDCTRNSNYFLSLSIENQLQTFLKDSRFVDSILNYRFIEKESNSPDSLHDLYDGLAYQEFFKNNGMLSEKYNFSYSFFTDGLAYGSGCGSKKTVWPVYLTVNELPYEERQKYIILAGMYAGDKDPNVQHLLRPFVEETNRLSSEGMQWTHNNEIVKSYVIPLCCIADSVARHKILGLQSFAAVFGCTFCYHESESTKVGQRYTLREAASLRTNESLSGDLCQVYERRMRPKPSDRVFRGVKTVSQLVYLSHFSFLRGPVVDYMHNILLGCTKFHLELMLQPVRKKMWIMNKDTGMDHLIACIDSRINQVQSCASIIRGIRHLKDRKNWRASEYRAWLVFYSIIMMKGLLKPKYLAHWSLLSKCTYILLKKTVTMTEVDEVQTLLLTYSYFFQKYFGRENMRYNIHLLSHVAEGVRNYGPIWNHNSFIYEAKNRYIRALSKNPNTVALEIAKKFLIYRSLPYLCDKMVRAESTVSFCEEITGNKRLKKAHRTNEGCILLGKSEHYYLSEAEQRCLAPFSRQTSCFRYKRFVFNRKRYCTANYCKYLKNNDSCILLSDGRFGIIREILMLAEYKIVLLVEVLRVSPQVVVQNSHTRINHLHRFQMTSKTVCVAPNLIMQPCLIVSVENDQYLSPIPYGCSVE